MEVKHLDRTTKLVTQTSSPVMISPVSSIMSVYSELSRGADRTRQIRVLAGAFAGILRLRSRGADRVSQVNVSARSAVTKSHKYEALVSGSRG